MTTGRINQLRAANDREAILKRVRWKNGIFVKKGNTMEKISTGTTVIYCPVCKGPVVDSNRGREAHAQRSPRCRSAIEP